jgi:hypothetical protein
VHASIPNHRLNAGMRVSIFIPFKNAKGSSMNTPTQPLPRDLRLEHKALYSVPDASGLTVTCVQGVVWLTIDGDPRDFVLEPGQTFETQDHGRVLIYALARSRISIADTAPTARPAPRRSARFASRLSAAGHA